MKAHKLVWLLLLCFVGTSVVFAGGSSVGVHETSIRDKLLLAGEENQKVMSFTVEPWESVPGDLKFTKIDFHCNPGEGFSKLRLFEGADALAEADFSEGVNGEMAASFGEIDFVIPNGTATEFELLVDVEEGTGDFVTACALDSIEFFNLESEIDYQAGHISAIFDTDQLVYVEDLDADNRNESVNIFGETNYDEPLEIESFDNKLLEFKLNGPIDIVVDDVFIYCSNASILKNIRLGVDGEMIDSADVNFDALTASRPEHSSEKRVVFSDLGVKIGYGSQTKTFELYGDTYDYFSLSEDKVPSCEVVDVMASTFISYPDIPEDHENFRAIGYLTGAEVFSGYDDGTFKPEKVLNRAEVLKIMMKSAGYAVGTTEDCFTDVKDEWFAPYICRGKELGIIEGYEDGSYKPDQLVNRAEAMKIGIEAFGLDVEEALGENPFPDTDKDEWFAPYVSVAKERGFLGDMVNYEPSAGMTRGDVSEIIYRLMEDRDK